ncbi:MAG: ABC transporter permease [Mycobacterium sp.]
MTSDDAEPTASARMAVDELRSLVTILRHLDRAAAAAEWDDPSALRAAVVTARRQLTSLAGGSDLAAAGASPEWLARAADFRREAPAPEPTSPGHAGADAVVAVEIARAATAEAVVAVWDAWRLAADDRRRVPTRRSALTGTGAAITDLSRRVGQEARHVVADKPRSILARLVITLGISLSLAAVYHFSGWSQYDDVSRLTLYLFSAVVGSVVCTNALCFEAQRVRAQLADGERLWRILVAKNLAMAALITVAALPVIVFLTVADGANPVALIDQLITMVFIWLGVGNVLSVVYPLRHEPVSARFADGTWKPYLVTFAVSYGVGLTVNLMIYWRLWARQTASEEIAGGMWAAFALVLASAVLSWILLTVFAVACSREPRLRRVLSREMVVYRK